MASLYDSTDISWSWHGDILPGDNGDLSDTSSDTLQSLRDQVSIICASSLEDWPIYPGKGAGLDDFIGEPNTRNTADAINDRLRISLVSAGIVNEDDLKIRVIPVELYRVMVIIYIAAIATATNSLEINGPLQVALVFDTVDKGLFFIQPPTPI